MNKKIRIITYVMFHIPYFIYLLDKENYSNLELYRYLEVISMLLFLSYKLFFKESKEYDSETKLSKNFVVINFERLLIGSVLLFSAFEKIHTQMSVISLVYFFTIALFNCTQFRIRRIKLDEK